MCNLYYSMCTVLSISVFYILCSQSHSFLSVFLPLVCIYVVFTDYTSTQFLTVVTKNNQFNIGLSLIDSLETTKLLFYYHCHLDRFPLCNVVN